MNFWTQAFAPAELLTATAVLRDDHWCGGDSRGNLCHQAACKVLQSKEVAEPQGTQAGCSPSAATRADWKHCGQQHAGIQL